MSAIVMDFFPQMRFMASQLISLCLSYWVLCIPFAAFAIDKIVDLLKKLY